MVLVALLEYSMLCMLVMFHHVARALTFSCDVQPQKAGDGPPSAKKVRLSHLPVSSTDSCCFSLLAGKTCTEYEELVALAC
eukprot:m.27468 g.27468  ORF g.27468 m.27468 type:complete len:81 (-) comp11754_c0_seq89:69-311(-)